MNGQSRARADVRDEKIDFDRCRVDAVESDYGSDEEWDACSDSWTEDAMGIAMLAASGRLHSLSGPYLKKAQKDARGWSLVGKWPESAPTETNRKKKRSNKKSNYNRNTCPVFARFRLAPAQVRALFLCAMARRASIPHDALCCVADHRYPLIINQVPRKSPWCKQTSYVVGTLLPRIKISWMDHDWMPRSMRWGPFLVDDVCAMVRVCAVLTCDVRVRGKWVRVRHDHLSFEVITDFMATEFRLSREELMPVFELIGLP